MAADFLNSKTRFNLLKSFVGESQARNRYTIAASQAKKEKVYVVADLFLDIAAQEKEHAEIFYEFLRPFSGKHLRLEGEYPVDLFDSTLEYLEKASQNEMEEYKSVYNDFGVVASDEGFSEISQKFFDVAKIEKTHADRFSEFAEMLKNNELFASKDANGLWVCKKCGNVYKGSEVPLFCPVCGHDRGYYYKVK